MSFEVYIPVKDKPRGVVIADRGIPTTFEIKDNITSVDEFSLYVARNSAVAFWLPAGAYAKITVFKNFDETNTPQFTFNYEVFHCNAMYSSEDEAELSLSDEKKAELNVGEIVWLIECPVGSGRFVRVPCPFGSFAVCNGDTPVCQPFPKGEPDGD